MMELPAVDAFRIKPIYDVLLRGTPTVPAGLFQLQLLTAEQLTRLHYSPGSIKMVKARLKTLTDYGFVQSDVIPSRRWRSPFYYTMGLAGMRYLDLAGLDMPPSWRASKQVNQHWLFVEHTLELNDVLISALLLKGNAHLHHFEHERALKRRPYKASWNGGTFTVIPDAFLDFRADGKRWPVLLEHDRGSEEQYFFRRRVRAYIMLLKTGSYQRLFGTSAVTILFTTFVGSERVEQMRGWVTAELAGESANIGALFRFVGLSRPLRPEWWREEVLR